MGVVNSCCIPRRSCDCGKTKRNGEHRGYHRTLSATFNMSVGDNDCSNTSSLVNINIATEEELMTLRGIDRATAKNIIEHRNQIGGFRCIEDIALVSGVGAAKYVQIQDDIFIPSSANSSPSMTRSEGNSLESPNDKSSLSIVSVNSANVFNLIRVKGIGMTIAKNIVDYRERNGKFNCLDELRKVKGIGPMLLDSIKVWLTVDEKTDKKPTANLQSNGKVTPVENGKRQIYNSSGFERRSTSSIENLLEILGPLAKVPVRPDVKPVSLKYKNKRIFRLASWNLQRFSKEKAMNPGVKDVVCMTILENSLGIVAVQELADKDALQEICQELNMPTLPNVKKWKGRRGMWKCCVSKAAGRMFQESRFIKRSFQSMEYHGFLYDESQDIQLVTSCLLESSNRGNPKPFTRMPFLAVFKINNAFDCVVVSVHLKATGLADEDKKRTENETDKLGDVVEAIHKKIKDENDVIILGDFNLGPNSKAFDDLRDNGYQPSIPANTYTNISQSNINGSENYDNIWLSRQTRSLLAGDSGVIRTGLSSPWIPDGWTWGGMVSDHCPVFTPLYASIDMDKDGDVTLAKEACFEV